MKYESAKKIFFTAFAISFLIFVDQLSKYIIRSQGGFYICNENIAFGIEVPAFIFWPAVAIAVIMLSLALWKCFMPVCVSDGGQIKSNRPNPLYLSLALAGILSNLIDRFFFGCVIDFINLKIWPVFNLADAMIVIGGILLILQNFRKNSAK